VRARAERVQPPVDERVRDGTMHHVDGVPPHAVRVHEELPVAEVSAQDEDAGAPLPADRFPPPRLVLEANHVAQPRCRQPGKMRQLGGHAPEVQERAAEDAAALAQRFLGKCERQIPHADASMRRVDQPSEERAELAEAQRDRERHERESPDDRAQDSVLDARAKRAHAAVARQPPTAPLRRERSRYALGRNHHGGLY
jgi:hypothetical protein